MSDKSVTYQTAPGHPGLRTDASLGDWKQAVLAAVCEHDPTILSVERILLEAIWERGETGHYIDAAVAEILRPEHAWALQR